jgi:hypothetical protein
MHGMAFVMPAPALGRYICHMRIALLASALLSTVLAFAQPASTTQRDLIQFSGVVVTGDSLDPVPFASIMVKDSHRGTVSDVYGYFSFVAQEGDTLQFAAVGFKRGQFVVPTDLPENKYSMIHQLYPDTILLGTANVYPWPTKEQFADAFLNMQLAEDDYLRAMRNLSPSQMIQQMEDMPPDPTGAYQSLAMLDQTKIYNQGMMPTINLMNPIAWAQFIQAWKAGAYKKK